jgi:hypothetical protein
LRLDYGYIPIDESYVKHGFFTPDGKPSPPGFAYGAQLLKNIWAVKHNSVRSISVDHFTKVDVNIPDGVLTPDEKLTLIGVNWLLSYMEKHIINRYTYHEITQGKKKIVWLDFRIYFSTGSIILRRLGV